MQGRGTLTFANYAIRFSGTSSLQLGSSGVAKIAFSGNGYLAISGSSNYGRATFPELVARGYEVEDVAIGYGSAEFPALVASGEESAYVAPTIQYGFAMFPQLLASGHMIASASGECTVNFPEMVAAGGEGYYGYGSAEFPELMASGSYDFMPGTAPLFTTILSLSGAVPETQHLVVLDNNLQVVDTISASREVIESILESISASDSYSVLGSFIVPVSEVGVFGVDYAPGVGDKQATPDDCTVWVVNLDTGATSQYDDYGFTDFFEQDGIYYGVAEDGIYQLDGDDDNGAEIDSLIDFGKSNFGTTARKRITSMYLASTSDDRLAVKVTADGQEYTYLANSMSSDDMAAHRVKIGKGLNAGFITLKLTNNNGCDFEAESLEFEVVTLPGRRQ